MEIWATEQRNGQPIRTFLGVPTCKHPIDPKALYIRIMYREFFFGPFTEAEATAAVNHLDKADSYWDYDCWTIVYGADPLPKDYVGGFPYAGDVRERINAQRIPFDQRPKDGPIS